jgi:hypothetical protein
MIEPENNWVESKETLHAVRHGDGAVWVKCDFAFKVAKDVPRLERMKCLGWLFDAMVEQVDEAFGEVWGHAARPRRDVSCARDLPDEVNKHENLYLSRLGESRVIFKQGGRHAGTFLVTAIRATHRVLLVTGVHYRSTSKPPTRIMIYPRFSSLPAPGYTFNDRVKLWIKARRAISKREAFVKARRRDIRHWPLEVRQEFNRVLDQEPEAMAALSRSEALGWQGEDLEE